MKRVRVTGPARRDVARTVRRSGAEFGEQASRRYRRLIDQALHDLAYDTSRAGVRAIDNIREGYFIYHLKWSRKGSTDVRQPRHLIAFYVDDSDTIIVARMFHERQMLAVHLNDDSHD